MGLHQWACSSLFYACRFPGTAAHFRATCIGPHLAAATKKLKSYFRGEAANSGKGLRAPRRDLIPRANRRWLMSDQANRFLGDSIGRTLIKLIVVSLIVGFVMTVFGLTPWSIIDG
ncbi:hypothetical protein ACCS96_34265, partial [Rhizobium ruizarguesonis]